MYLLNHFRLDSEDATTSNFVHLTPQGENDSQTVREGIMTNVEPFQMVGKIIHVRHRQRPSSPSAESMPLKITTFSSCPKEKMAVKTLEEFYSPRSSRGDGEEND